MTLTKIVIPETVIIIIGVCPLLFGFANRFCFGCFLYRLGANQKLYSTISPKKMPTQNDHDMMAIINGIVD